MTLSQHTSSAPILLLILYSVIQRLTVGIPVVGDKNSNAAGPSDATLSWPAQAEAGDWWKKGVNLGQVPQEKVFENVDPRTIAVALLESLIKPGEQMGNGKIGGEKTTLGGLWNTGDHALSGPATDASYQGYKQPEGEGQVVENRAVAEGTELQKEQELGPTSGQIEDGQEEAVGEQKLDNGLQQDMEEKGMVRSLQTFLEKLQRHARDDKEAGDVSLNREVRGYFPNIDLGLQDNEILPPLKGYKLYNQQLAQAGKKLKWQEEKTRKTQPVFSDTNFMRDFEEGEDDADDDEEEFLTREEEEARARAEQEEVRRQAAEAQRARAEEERLADIASDHVLQYMVKKQAAGYANKRRKAALASNAVEDKRSEEEEDDDDDIDPQTIDKLIEISSKLHLPADDVVDIISDVEEKKKRKDAPQNFPRYRPLVPPPVPASHYSSPIRSHPLIRPYGKWFKSKAKTKSWKPDFWSKPQKQLLAYPSYQFYQKPYRAYYPIYFQPPKPKPRYYAKSRLSFGELLENSMDQDFDIPKRRYQPWNQLRFRKRPAHPQSPYISNYILPHPRTYQARPIAKPRSTSYMHPSPYYSMVGQDDSYYDLTGAQQDSDEELENFIEKVYLKRRLFQ
ncbi:hypothetical protein Z043_111782 [Scleropages formosus]|uniref:Uncharacterized LOC108934285 n=1 Tax=Scleropages formosus TaxID=113540 RepID=A0A0P7ULJ9_SCLFO|nr:uncharacterized protein LOC108934285 [Scleropages formosus]XP_029107303.1 uncharacterized protein LOC114910442 [Scleropages formosus]KPP69459.1 hypothetical protein Z043_111782 [Scleropages formosus]